MGTQIRNYKHGDQKHLYRSIMAITSGPIKCSMACTVFSVSYWVLYYVICPSKDKHFSHVNLLQYFFRSIARMLIIGCCVWKLNA